MNVLKAFGILLLVILITTTSCGVGLAIGAATGGGDLALGQPAVAVVYVEGPIQGGRASGLLDSGGAYSETIVSQLRRAERDNAVKAVILRVDSPGGGVTPSDEIRNQIVKLAQKKPVVASFGSLAASGGYYVSAPASKIISNETTITGSIGVITVVPNIQGLMEKLGIDVSVLKSGPQKDETAGLRPLTETDRQVLQGVVDESFERFVTVVSEGRNMPKDQVKKLADGRIYTGSQAMKLGLVDQFGDLPEAIQAAADLGRIPGNPRVIHYRRGGGILGGAGSMLLERLGLPVLPLPTSGGSQPFSIQYLYIAP